MEVMTVVSPQILCSEFENTRIVSTNKKEDIPEVNWKMQLNVMTCTKCSEDFSENNVPRILTCGHSMCYKCVNEIPICEIVCSECYKKNTTKKGAELPVNYPLLRLIQSLGDNRIDFEGINKPFILTSESSSDDEIIKMKCSGHGNALSYFCCSCSAWACHDCLVTDHRFLPRGSCRLVKLKDGMNLVKSQHKNIIDKILKDVGNMKRGFHFDMGIHDFCRKHCSVVDRTYHIYLVEMVENQLEEVKKETYSFINNIEGFAKKSAELAEKTDSPEDLANSLKSVITCQKSLEEDIENVVEKKLPLLKLMVEHFKLDLKLLVKGGTPVYAITEQDDEPMWTQIALKDTLLSLYSLKKGKPPKDGVIIPYEYAKHTYPKDETTIFFDVGTEEKEMGRICVKLDEEDNEMCEQMILMCSGVKGVSHRGTCFYGYDKKEGRLHGGDYENNNGTGGTIILDDMSVPLRRRRRASRKQMGALMNDGMSTRFYFYVNSRSNQHRTQWIGVVTSGLRTLKLLMTKADMETYIVKDCGIIIPMMRRKVEPALSDDEDDWDERL